MKIGKAHALLRQPVNMGHTLRGGSHAGLDRSAHFRNFRVLTNLIDPPRSHGVGIGEVGIGAKLAKPLIIRRDQQHIGTPFPGKRRCCDRTRRDQQDPFVHKDTTEKTVLPARVRLFRIFHD